MGSRLRTTPCRPRRFLPSISPREAGCSLTGALACILDTPLGSEALVRSAAMRCAGHESPNFTSAHGAPMDTDYYVIASVMAAALMVVEFKISKARKIEAYRFSDTVNNLSNYLGELVLTAILYLNVFIGYQFLERHVALFELPRDAWATWAFTLLGLDLVYYWGHRLCHRVALLWALHTVHHQSREYNLGVGLRGPWLSALQIAPFMIPIAAAGVPSSVLFPLYGVHTVWKLLVHTRLVGKLGPLEWVLATPSQHRVHHGVNERYLDKNFGGLFSFWDRIFGTYQVEDEEPLFGADSPLETLNPVANNLAPWRDLVVKARRAPGPLGWARALIMPPTWEPAHGDAPEHARLTPTRRAPAELSRGTRIYLSVQLVVAAMVTLTLLAFGNWLPLAVAWGAGIWSIGTVVCLSGLMERERWALRAESVRLGLSAAAAITLTVVWRASA
jgi:alkylglycerol monooxygenase